ncbi:MAG: response regulator [Patescibacteria group bacterium]|jgi:DNA-binding response OmpR family regulator
MKKILIIEDEDTISGMYKASMEKAGYSVVLATNGEKGLEMAKTEKPDLILLDIMMPKMDGFTVLEKVKSNDNIKDVPVVMLTNLGQEDDREKGRKLGADDYWVKADFTPAQVNEKIKQYIK